MHFGTFLHVVSIKILINNAEQFKEGIKPLWEDEHCKDGGRFQIRVPKTHGSKFWENLLLAMIGEQF